MNERSTYLLKSLLGISILSLALGQAACTWSSGGGAGVGASTEEPGTPASYFVFDACSGAIPDSCGLWKLDGSSDPVELKAPATNFVGPYNFTYVDGKYFFTARDAANSGRKRLWVTDGTSAGTQQLNFQNTLNDLSVTEIIPFGKNVLFVADDNPATYEESIGGELYISDGTVAGTRLVKDINPGAGSSAFNTGFSSSFFVLNGKAYFSALHGDYGVELFVTDGTPSGTKLVKDLSPGHGHSFPNSMMRLGDRFVFSATAAEGQELWISDGTESGTTLVLDLAPGNDSSSPTNMKVIGNKLYFAARATNSGSKNPYVSDGTPSGTFRIAEINPAGDPEIGWFMKVGSQNKIAFSAKDSDDKYKIFITDGTLGSASPLNETWTSSPDHPVNLGDLLIVNGCQASTDCEPWVTDGTNAGTRILKDINPGNGRSYFNKSFKFGNTLFFGAYDGTNGMELWSTDGTPSGTKMVKDLNSGADSSYPFEDGFTYD